MIISAFPGTGKTYFYKKYRKKLKVSDSDSSKFSKDKFPENYIKHIKRIKDKYDVIFVSSHKEVRDELLKNKIDFYVVIPSVSLRDEYIKRFEERGSPKEFIELISKNWFNWLKEITYDPRLHTIILGENQYIEDILKTLLQR